jgi:hypothetical protein
MQVLCSSLILRAMADSHSFTDDEGTKHTWTKAKPTILMNARSVLSLMHFGLGADQLHATWGEHSNSGTNYDHGDEGCVSSNHAKYYDGNMADYGNHDVAFDPSSWTGHPSEAEMNIIKQAIDLSPKCSSCNYWCADLEWEDNFGFTGLGGEAGGGSKGWPDLIIDDYSFGYATTPEFLGNASANGAKIIVMKLTSPGAAAGDDPVKKNYIEVARRYEELAIALGAVGPDDEAANLKEKAAFCKAAEDFKEVAKGAADRGVRALAGYFPYDAAPAHGDLDNGPDDGLNADGKTIFGFLYGPASSGFPALKLLEELGMQILHIGDMPDYNAHMAPDNLKPCSMGVWKTHADACTAPDGYYPVDFFLYDDRTTLDVTSATFAEKWPHPAVVAGQMAPWSNGGQGVYSYEHATEMLTMIGAKLKDATKVDSTTTTCTDVEVISSQVHRSDGLSVTEYACYNPVELPLCDGWESWVPTPKPATDSESASALAAVGLMLAVLA